METTTRGKKSTKAMTNKERAKRIVDGVKRRLKTETDPDQRHGLAIVGEEFNILHMQLSNYSWADSEILRKKISKHWKK